MKKEQETPIRSVCVYCGSSMGSDPAFADQAHKLGENIALSGHRLVYGGGDIGLMGTIAKGALSQGGSVLGIIPEFLLNRELGGRANGLDGADLVTVPDMHTRKQRMFDEADAFIAMPGGIGTLEELVEILTWAQLARHEKPIGLLNINNFWSPYLELISHMREAGFLHNANRIEPLVFETADTVIEGLFPKV